MRTPTSLRALPLLTLALAGCNRTPPEPTMSPSTEPSAATAPTPTPAAGAAAGRPTVTGAMGSRPRIEIPSGSPPTSLQQYDLVTGTGAEARNGSTVEVQYSGVAWSNRREFDSSWNRPGQPFSFPLGAGRVIPGWDQGVAGMRVGGRRLLVIPPRLGYGERGAGSDIGPNETLVFVVDLVGVR